MKQDFHKKQYRLASVSIWHGGSGAVSVIVQQRRIDADLSINIIGDVVEVNPSNETGNPASAS